MCLLSQGPSWTLERRALRGWAARWSCPSFIRRQRHVASRQIYRLLIGMRDKPAELQLARNCSLLYMKDVMSELLANLSDHYFGMTRWTYVFIKIIKTNYYHILDI